jgi:hypothetical protein
MERIIDSQGKKFMSEFLKDLPKNTMLNKVLTGCGGTTIALSNSVPYVICVPFRAMITNKLKWAVENDTSICPVMGGESDEKIKKYKGNKYIVTYDSLHRLNNFINPKDFKILIDESHKLIDSAGFRNDAIDIVLDNYKRYGSYVFMTATPVKNQYQLPELKEIDQAKIKWYGVENVNIKLIVPNRPLNEEVAVIAARHLTGGIPSNAHIFINSVKSIIDILNTIDQSIVSPEHINIVCAINDKNEEKLMATMGKYWTIKNVGEVAKVNFYTSTAFEGSDIYDENGKTYVVTDGMKDYTKNDILTTLPQIIGRIRDTKYKNDIDLIYTSSPYYGNGITEEDYQRIVMDELERAAKYVDFYNKVDLPDVKKALYDGSEDDKFIKQLKDDALKVNFSAAHYEMHSFNALHTTYYSFPNNELDRSSMATVNDVPYIYTNSKPTIVSMADRVLLKRKENFPDIFKFLIDNLDDENLTADIKAMHPEMMDYIRMLGIEKIAALKYRKKAVKNEFIKESVMSNHVKMVKMLDYHVNQFISNDQIKTKLTCIYEQLGISKSANAYDINRWYETRTKLKRNSKTNTIERGYEIAMCKVKIHSDDDIRSKNAVSNLLQALTIPIKGAVIISKDQG